MFPIKRDRCIEHIFIFLFLYSCLISERQVGYLEVEQPAMANLYMAKKRNRKSCQGRTKLILSLILSKKNKALICLRLYGFLLHAPKYIPE